ncbi:Chaperone protein HtpG [Methylobacterium bullatum]|uniref:Chaperone protein HtpG n=1 Tax=Methylobacterium bullatum TaxID=570505 RepID=A0A679J1E2_9HYPH|nr:Chaperone protein HtpG [Methylobacterium bullatum]
MPTYDRTNLWTQSLGAAPGDPEFEPKERLRSAYRQFWANAVMLSREIQRDLPNLTLHDDAHFDALWHRADQIAGSCYSLSPLETFVFGGAILLHDTANSIAAFPGRLAEIQSTPGWRDAAAEWFDRNNVDPAQPMPQNANASVLFETLRAAHAERAESLASMKVRNGDHLFFLLQDDQLRAHLGPLIGSIAASHHWDISTLPSRLTHRRGSLSGLPESWFVRPVLLACLLRCADATQLDQQRAPDFLYGLLQLRGISELHWRAQNRLSTPHVDPEDPHALVFTSTMPFGQQDADAWWIVHDAIQVATRELQASENLLRDLRLPPFALNRVRNAGSPTRLADLVAVSGWRPVAAEIKVTRVEKIVDLFGGEKLYGQELSVPLRELLQNAADAIAFRRALEPPDSAYEGSITVRIDRNEENTDENWLIVDDDGLGMSEAVLTGPLIDFGSSYVSSSLVKTERPGLLAKGKKRIGKFGIGFFSSFMLGDEVRVTSRPFDEGLDACRTLQFRNGVIARPLLLDTRPPSFGISISTRVAIRMTAKSTEDLLLFSEGGHSEKISISLSELIGLLCPMLNVDVYIYEGGRRTKIHSREWMSENRQSWLNRILLVEKRPWRDFSSEVSRAAARMSYIDPTDPSCGLACIANIGGTGVPTIGTLRSGSSIRSFMDEIVGSIDYEGDDPHRMQGTPRAFARLANWATEQATIAKKACLEPQELRRIAERVAGFGGDSTCIAKIELNRSLVSIEDVFSRLAEGSPIYAPLRSNNSEGSHFTISTVRERQYGFLDNYADNELRFIVDTIEAAGHSDARSNYYQIPTEKHNAAYGFCSLLNRYAKEKGFHIEGTFIEKIDFAEYIGQPSEREDLLPGKVIGCMGIKLSASRIEQPG